MNNINKIIALIFVYVLNQGVINGQDYGTKALISDLQKKLDQRAIEGILNRKLGIQTADQLRDGSQLNQNPVLGLLLKLNLLEKLLGGENLDQSSNIINLSNDRERQQREALLGINLKALLPLLKTSPIDRIPISDKIIDRITLNGLIGKSSNSNINPRVSNSLRQQILNEIGNREFNTKRAIDNIKSEIFPDVNEFVKTNYGLVSARTLPSDVSTNNPLLNQLLIKILLNQLSEKTPLNLNINEVLNREQQKQNLFSRDRNSLTNRDTNIDISSYNSGPDLGQLVSLLQQKNRIEDNNRKKVEILGNNPVEANVKNFYLPDIPSLNELRPNLADEVEQSS